MQGINATLTDHNGMTALHWAVAVNAMPVAIRLLRRFPQLMEKCTHKGETILHIMCREGHDNLLHVIMCTFPTAYLLVNHRDCEERTAKELAEQLQNQECLQFLQTNQQPTVWLQGFLQQRCIDRYTHTHTHPHAHTSKHIHTDTHTHIHSHKRAIVAVYSWSKLRSYKRPKSPTSKSKGTRRKRNRKQRGSGGANT